MFLSNIHRFKIILVFMIDDYGGITILTAKGVSETGSDVTSRWSDHGFPFVFQQHYQSILYRFFSISGLPPAEYSGISISADREHNRPEMTLPLDSLIPICFRLAVGISHLYRTFQNLFDYFDLH
jgi:hypothetical protein